MESPIRVIEGLRSQVDAAVAARARLEGQREARAAQLAEARETVSAAGLDADGDLETQLAEQEKALETELAALVADAEVLTTEAKAAE